MQFSNDAHMLYIDQRLGVERLLSWVEYLLWANEPIEALRILDNLPAVIDDDRCGLPDYISATRAMIASKLAHLRNFAAYRDAYEASYRRATDYGFDLTDLRKFERFTKAEAWAKALPQNGPTLEVSVIGGQGGFLEAALLAASHRIATTSSEVARVTQPSLTKLADLHPGRVRVHQVERSACDWAPGPFDAIFIFEVLEHVPDVDEAMTALVSSLKPTGELWISVPNSPLAPHLTLNANETMYEHVRSFNTKRLTSLLRKHKLTGHTELIDGVNVLLAVVHKA